MLFEDKLAKKYAAQRCARDNARTKAKKEQKKKEEEEKSIATLLKEMREDIKEIKSDNKEIKENLTDMNVKIDKIETKQKEYEHKNDAEFKEIRNEMLAKNKEIQDLRKEI